MIILLVVSILLVSGQSPTCTEAGISACLSHFRSCSHVPSMDACPCVETLEFCYSQNNCLGNKSSSIIVDLEEKCLKNKCNCASSLDRNRWKSITAFGALIAFGLIFFAMASVSIVICIKRHCKSSNISSQKVLLSDFEGRPIIIAIPHRISLYTPQQQEKTQI